MGRLTPWIALLLVACARAPHGPEGAESNTSLPRFYQGEFVALSDLRDSRAPATACAQAIALLERELREPWLETRTARVLLANARLHDTPAFAQGTEIWLGAEPRAPGADRNVFREFGVYRVHRPIGAVIPRAEVDSMESYAATLLRTCSTDTPAARLLSGWRQLAPLVCDRGQDYLASSWSFELAGGARISLQDSLLGPFSRCTVADAGAVSGLGPMRAVGSFQMAAEIADLVEPGPMRPMAILHESLLADLQFPRQVALSPGPMDRSEEGAAFLTSALRGLRDGLADLEYIPSGASAFAVMFSFMVGNMEARVGLNLSRVGFNAWRLDAATYEPAAASLVGRGASFDLMPLLRARQGT